MILRIVLLAIGALTVVSAADPIRYSEDGKLVRPEDYREWIFLNSGLGMTYGPAGGQASRKHPFFDNVFVNRDAHRAFLESGKWPDKTIFVLEIRGSDSHASINRDGHFQRDVVAIEAAVKDESRFPEKWAYFGFNAAPGAPAATAAPEPKSAGCFACHSANGAVDNTFVQFYPTLYEVAEKKGTLRTNFERHLPTTVKLYQTLSTQGWAESRRLLDAAALKNPDTPLVEEAGLNTLGYQLLAAEKKSEAVELLAWVAARYSSSANAQDSLSEACVAAGDKARAAAAAEKTLALLPGDPSLNDDLRKRLERSARDRLASLK